MNTTTHLIHSTDTVLLNPLTDSLVSLKCHSVALHDLSEGDVWACRLMALLGVLTTFLMDVYALTMLIWYYWVKCGMSLSGVVLSSVVGVYQDRMASLVPTACRS